MVIIGSRIRCAHINYFTYTFIYKPGSSLSNIAILTASFLCCSLARTPCRTSRTHLYLLRRGTQRTSPPTPCLATYSLCLWSLAHSCAYPCLIMSFHHFWITITLGQGFYGALQNNADGFGHSHYPFRGVGYYKDIILSDLTRVGPESAPFAL